MATHQRSTSSQRAENMNVCEARPLMRHLWPICSSKSSGTIMEERVKFAVAMTAWTRPTFIFEGKRAKSQVRIPNYSPWEILCCPAHNVAPHLCPFIHPLGHTFVWWFCPIIYELNTEKKICIEYYWIWIISTAKDRINLPSIGWKGWKILPHPHLLPTWWIFICERPWLCWHLASLAVLSSRIHFSDSFCNWSLIGFKRLLSPKECDILLD